MEDSDYILERTEKYGTNCKIKMYYTGKAWVTDRARARGYDRAGLEFILPIFKECKIKGVRSVRK